MLETIRQIINGIPRNGIFDTHLVINQLIKKHTDAYLNYATSINAQENKTMVVHGNIGILVGRLRDEGLIRQLEHEAYSETIHGTISNCACWQKV